jgi:hypothetical protein
MNGRGSGVGRRRALGIALAGVAFAIASAHAPYGQWGVYRKRFLLILTTREDPATYELGEQVAAILAARLPESRAQVTRAPSKARIGSLLSSHQMDLALMHHDDAAALRSGTPPFVGHGPMPLHAILAIGDYLLVCRDDFAARHAWLIADALAQDGSIPVAALVPAAAVDAAPAARVPLHPGALAFFTGAPVPKAGPDDGYEGHAHDPATQH